MKNTVFFIDNVNSKLHNKDLENIQDDMYTIRENVLYLLSFEKFVKDGGGSSNNNDDDDDESE